MIWIVAIILGAGLWALLDKFAKPRPSESEGPPVVSGPAFDPAPVPGPDPAFDSKALQLASVRDYDGLAVAYLKAWNAAEDRLQETGDESERAAAYIYKQNQVRFYVARVIQESKIDDLDGWELLPGMDSGCPRGPIPLSDFVRNSDCLPCRVDCPCLRPYPCDPIIRPKK